MTPEQQARLEQLRDKRELPVRQEESERPVHFSHAHYATSLSGKQKCLCPENCLYCGVKND
jgi:biotin synthase-like enzyme